MKIRELDLNEHQDRIDEIAALIPMVNWFSQKYQDVIAAGARKMGEGEIQKFTNQHLKAFMQMMGRYKVDWPTVTMYVTYQYLRLIMKLNDQDILDVINSTVRDPKIKAKKILTIQQIKDQDKDTLLSSFSSTGGVQAKTNQLIAQMIIAAGAMRQIERHWERQAGVQAAPARSYTSSTQAGRTTRATQATTAAPGTSAAAPTQMTAINSALSQLGVT